MIVVTAGGGKVLAAITVEVGHNRGSGRSEGVTGIIKRPEKSTWTRLEEDGKCSKLVTERIREGDRQNDAVQASASALESAFSRLVAYYKVAGIHVQFDGVEDASALIGQSNHTRRFD